MSNGRIIFFDDDKDIINQFEELISESDFSVIKYNDIESLRTDLSIPQNLFNVKVLIFDLARSKAENGSAKEFEILQDIHEKFHNYRLPIFIHSAFANDIDQFRNKGTVWKVEKSGNSLLRLVEIINKLHQSGFLDTFMPNGIVEQQLFAELHKSFTEQFRDGEIEKIINSVQETNGTQFRDRSIQIFRRIAIRSLMSEILSPVISENEGVNPIEHYYRRISKLDFWTGDIIRKKDGTEFFLVLTPRCNVQNDINILVCPIEIGDFPPINNSKGRDAVGYALTDKPEVSGYNRYLPPSPIFEGGKVLLSKYLLIDRNQLKHEFDLLVTLSDELTNELLGKFGSYFFRTGITPWSKTETIAHMKDMPS